MDAAAFRAKGNEFDLQGNRQADKKKGGGMKALKIWLCRFTSDIHCPKEKCCNYKKGTCDVDSEDCNSEEYVKKGSEKKRVIVEIRR